MRNSRSTNNIETFKTWVICKLFVDNGLGFQNPGLYYFCIWIIKSKSFYYKIWSDLFAYTFFYSENVLTTLNIK